MAYARYFLHNPLMLTADSLERSLKAEIDSVMRRRGKDYYEGGAVGTCVYEAEKVIATWRDMLLRVTAPVHGSDTYGTELVVNTDSGELKTASCDCPYFEENEVYCKHIAALGCAIVARMRKVFGKEGMSENASYVASALTKGKVVGGRNLSQGSVASSKSAPDAYASVREKLTHLGFDMSLATETLLEELSRIMPVAPATQQPARATEPTLEASPLKTIKKPPEEIHELPVLFGERYVCVLRTGYQSVQVSVCDTEQVSGPWMQNNTVLSRPALQSLLKDSALHMNDHECALVLYLSKYDPWATSYDAYQALLLVQAAQVRLYRDSLEESRRIAFTTGPLPIAVSLKREVWDSYSRHGTPRPKSHFEFARQELSSRGEMLAITTRGLVYLHKRNAMLIPSTADVRAMLKRTEDRRAYYSSRKGPPPATTITDDEATRINDIITELQRSFSLTTELTPDFAITKYDTAEPALLVNYDTAASRLVICGAVDYGCEVLDVSEEWYMQGYGSGTARPLRRTGAREHPLVVSIEGERIGYAPVDTKKEEMVFRALYDAHGFNKIASLTRTGTKPIEKFLHEHWDALTKLGWKIIFTQDEIKYATSEIRTDMAVDLDAERDWLAFDLALYCGDERVRLEDVIAFIERGDECLKTEDGRLIRVTNRADLERLVRMIERFSQNAAGKFEGRLYNAPEIADVASNSPHYRAQFAKSFDTFMKEARCGKPVQKVTLPVAHKKLLRPYQATGVEWMHFLRRYRFGGILADEMGLGKTIQALSHIAVHTKEGESSLVVCPKTLLHNWEREALTRFPDLSVAVIEGTALERKKMILQKKNVPHLFITSYPLAQRDSEWYAARKKPFHYLLLDEAQSIKNPRTKNAHAVKAISAEYRLALTGTPLENSVEELWSIFDFLMPGFLGHHASFQKHFGKPIMDGEKGALVQLKAKTSCFMLRRTKGEVLKELPPKIEQTLRVELSDDQNVLYQEVLARTRTELFAEVEKRGFKRAQIHILAALTRLRQICNHPALVEPKGEYTSGKLDACLEIVREIKAEGRKVLVFSQFTSMLDLIAESLSDEKIPFSILTGKTGHRQELVDAFNADPAIPVFLISLKAGGTGLNLTSADAVIIFDPWWNPAVENQAIDRTHRIGQTKTVNVYRLITTGTIEEKILALQAKKKSLFDALVSENSELFKKLTWDDVQDLFR